MKRYAYSIYQLNSVKSPNSRTTLTSRSGALLRVTFSDGRSDIRVGYGDCHPLPEYGDAKIQTQLEGLYAGSPSDLMKRTLAMAEMDAEMRAQGQNAFAANSGGPTGREFRSVRNHFLFSDVRDISQQILTQLTAQGFLSVKLKVGRELEFEASMIRLIAETTSLKVRLDFNSSIDLERFREFVCSLGVKGQQCIEFVEDPFRFEYEKWSEANKLLPLAADFEFENILPIDCARPLPFRCLIIKPARQDVGQSIQFCHQHDLKAVITSSMDHPVGVSHAMNVAQTVLRDDPELQLDAGCLTFNRYDLPEFNSQVQISGPFLAKVIGTGIGFDRVLSELNWQDLSAGVV